MRPSKVLFVIPKTKSLFGDEEATPGHPHGGVAYLCSVLRENNVEVMVFDEGIERNEERLSEAICDFKPTLIGITGFSYNYHYLYDAIALVKEMLKPESNAYVVVGGPHVSATRKEILLETEADFAVKGEGELTILELVKEIGKPQPDFSKIDGLIWRDGEKIVENKDRKLVEDLDSLPFPDYEVFGLEKYPCFEEKTLPLITSRGCPYQCIFCSVRLSFTRRWRARSPENVVNEIEYWYNKGFKNFEINDDCFTLDMDRAKRICDLIVERKLKITYQLYNGIRADRVDRELLQKMKQSGCTFISIGCESGNESVLKMIKKGVTLEQVRKAVEWANEVGIKTSVNFIIGHPGETFESAMDSIRFAKSLPCSFVNFYNLVPYPGTEVYEWAKENARFLFPSDRFLREVSYRDDEPIFETAEFTKEERRKVLRAGFALYERTILQFRFGKRLGYVIYLMTRFRPLARIGRNLIFENRIAKKIYMFFYSKSLE